RAARRAGDSKSASGFSVGRSPSELTRPAYRQPDRTRECLLRDTIAHFLDLARHAGGYLLCVTRSRSRRPPAARARYGLDSALTPTSARIRYRVGVAASAAERANLTQLDWRRAGAQPRGPLPAARFLRR